MPRSQWGSRAVRTGLRPSQMTCVTGVIKNSNGPGASASYSPAAGGVLIAAIHVPNANATFTPGGTLTGTWTLLASSTDGASSTHAVYACVDYGASGTTSFVPSVGTQVQFVVDLVVDAGLLNL